MTAPGAAITLVPEKTSSQEAETASIDSLTLAPSISASTTNPSRAFLRHLSEVAELVKVLAIYPEA
jgi:hypothetical protein